MPPIEPRGGVDASRARVRPAAAGDAPALSRIAVAAKRSWGYPDAWIEAWMPILSIDPQFIAQHAVWVGMMDDGEPAGWSALAEEGGRAQLDHLWVLPANQRRGLGRLLLDAVVQEAARRGHRVLRVESDPYAAAFYERHGARNVGSVDAPVLGTARTLPLLEIPLRKEDPR